MGKPIVENPHHQLYHGKYLKDRTINAIRSEVNLEAYVRPKFLSDDV